jgi:hypothetical protein
MVRGITKPFKWHAGLLIVIFMLFSTPTPFIHSSANESSHAALRGMEFHTETVSRAPSGGIFKYSLTQWAMLVLLAVAALSAPRVYRPLPPCDAESRMFYQLLRKRLLLSHKFSSNFLS